MMMQQPMRAVPRTDPRPAVPRRVNAWHRDGAARASAIARWEDDGGLVGRARTRPERALSSDGRMTPHATRDI